MAISAHLVLHLGVDGDVGNDADDVWDNKGPGGRVGDCPSLIVIVRYLGAYSNTDRLFKVLIHADGQLINAPVGFGHVSQNKDGGSASYPWKT